MPQLSILSMVSTFEIVVVVGVMVGVFILGFCCGALTQMRSTVHDSCTTTLQKDARDELWAMRMKP